MNTLTTQLLRMIFLAGAIFSAAHADDVKILAAEFKHINGSGWLVSVTLKHADSGWDHYADGWRIVDQQGTLLGERVLAHPHIDEQPFSRSLGNVELPTSGMIYIEAHDTRHGWALQRLALDMAGRQQLNFTVRAGDSNR